VIEALRERFDRLQNRPRKASVDELRAIAARAAAHLKGPYPDHSELFYDERGLPNLILDTSALVAVLYEEPEADLFTRIIHDAERCLILRRAGIPRDLISVTVLPMH
jgi:antitoxin VapB